MAGDGDDAEQTPAGGSFSCNSRWLAIEFEVRCWDLWLSPGVKDLLRAVTGQASGTVPPTTQHASSYRTPYGG